MESSSSAAAVAKVTLFEDIFDVIALNPDGYKFENVNRIQAIGTTFECDLLLDMNCAIYPLKDHDKFTLVLASTLHLDGSPADHNSYIPRNTQSEPNLSDHYEYVMHGRVFDTKFTKDGNVTIAVSYGGLLMRISGDSKHLSAIRPDQRLYLLIKKD
jgi:DNA-directed RNA polymerases I, II, and III subunit RPABC3